MIPALWVHHGWPIAALGQSVFVCPGHLTGTNKKASPCALCLCGDNSILDSHERRLRKNHMNPFGAQRHGFLFLWILPDLMQDRWSGSNGVYWRGGHDLQREVQAGVHRLIIAL